MGRLLADRLERKIERIPESGCWLWTGSLNGTGYGKIRLSGVLHYAHRVTYELSRGPIPAGMQIDHLCRVRCCVNPAHLEPVTGSVNIMRGDHYGRRQTHCVHGHEFTPENTRIRKGRGMEERVCLACEREHDHGRPR